MKYIQLYENYSAEKIKKELTRSAKRGDIKMNISPDDFINQLEKTSKPGTFENFIEHDGEFISVGDSLRMDKYIEKFKEIGLDTSKVERLYPKYKRSFQIWYTEEDDIKHSGMSEEEINTALNKLWDEQDTLRTHVEEFEKEIRKLATELNSMIDEGSYS